MATIKPVSQACWRVTISGQSAYFTTFSGLEVERENSKVPQGNSRIKVPVYGLSEIADVDLSKPYEVSDSAFISLLDQPSTQGLTVVIQAVDDSSKESPIGRPITLSGCSVTKVKVGEADRDSSDATMTEITLAVGSYKVG